MARVGWREKKILLLMLKDDEPKGKPNPVWFDLYREFKINYSSLPKLYQPVKLGEERNLRQSLYHLVRRGLIKPVLIAQPDSSLPSPKAYGYVFYCLTKVGRLVAEKLRMQERELCDLEVLEGVLAELCGRGCVYVTVGEVREVLWQRVRQNFDNQEAFLGYWNNTKLGLLLRKCVSGRSLMGKWDGRRKYCLKDDTVRG